MNEEYEILIADDHLMFLDGVKLILKQQANLRVAAEAVNGEQVLELLSSKRYDLLVTDLNMPGMKGIDLIQSIKHRYPDQKVLVISMHNEHQLVNEVLMAEAEGYILKNSGKTELLFAINTILQGKTHYDKAVLDTMVQNMKNKARTQNAVKSLTPREQEILLLIAEEYTSKEIADKLFISKQTVDKHRLNIMEKTGAQTLVGLIKYAIQNQLTP